MYIIVAGGGMVGGELIKKLVDNKHDVVVIDQNKEVCNKIYSETGAIAIHGNAANTEILEDAGIKKADVLVAATSNDTDNLAAAILAKSYGVTQIITRMRNASYENAYKISGATTILRLADLVVNQMIIAIEKPKVRKVMTIGAGKADIYSVLVPDKSKIIGKSIQNITKDSKFPPQCVFIALYNSKSDTLSIPRGQDKIKEGDEIFVISNVEDMKKIADYITA